MIKKVLFYAMVALYSITGFVHFFQDDIFITILPDSLPYKSYLISISGAVELLLAFMLLDRVMRSLAINLIEFLLSTYLILVLIPLTFNLYITQSPYFVYGLFTIPIQLLFMAWAWWYKEPTENNELDSLI